MAKIKVDNFDRIQDILSFNSDDDFFYVVVIRRGKDNNFDEEVYDEILPGRTDRARYLKGFVVKSYDDLLSYRDEITSLCDENNARAYITINPKSFSWASNEPNFMVAAIDPISGYDKRGLLDVDFNDELGFKELDELLERNMIFPIFMTISPDGGKQYVLPNEEARNIDFAYFNKYDEIGRGMNGGDFFVNDTIHFLPDTMVNLYANLK